MPRPKSIIPTYRLHKGSGQAVAYVNRQRVYLGVYGSPESRETFSKLLDRLRVGETVANAKAARAPRQTVFTLNDLFLRFVTEELPRYSRDEQFCLKSAIRPARELFGETAAAEFGPLRLRTVRDAMIMKGWSRSFINKEVKRLRMVLRWGVGWELVPQTVVDSLSAVKSLSAGESDAPESRPRRAIPAADLEAVRAVLTDRQRDIFDLMLLTGCRPGELLSLTTGQIDRSAEVWRADLARHKTARQGKSRTLFFNATAQAILVKYFHADPDRPMFGLKRNSFGNAVKSACAKAGVPPFTPHWLRHTVATRLADEVGTDAAQRLLGHATVAMTMHYSRAAERQAIEAAKKLG